MRVVFPMPSDRDLAYMDLCGWKVTREAGTLVVQVRCTQREGYYHEFRLPQTTPIGDAMQFDGDLTDKCSSDFDSFSTLKDYSPQAIMVHLLMDIRALLRAQEAS